MLSRQRIMNNGLGDEVTFSMGCPVHSDMILFRFALWYMISLACNAHYISDTLPASGDKADPV